MHTASLTVFFALCLASVFLRRCPSWRNLALLIGGYAFLVRLFPQSIAPLLGITALGYVGAVIVERTSKKSAWLTVFILLHLGVFALYKLPGEWLAQLPQWKSLETLRLFVPIGLSFVLFQNIGYLVDVRRGTIAAERSIVRFALYLSFFPKLFAGPIERAERFLPQLKQPTTWNQDVILESMQLIAAGAVMKFVIADNAALIADPLFAPDPGHTSLFIGLLAYTVQIYCDFAGYSAMAKGIAGLLGIELSWNFRAPYLCSNPSAFWKHWHITLSEWFRDYVYIPLGGSRKGEWRTLLHLLCIMTLCGLWHGFGTIFLAWGVYQGLLLCGYRLMNTSGVLRFAGYVPYLLRCGFFFALTMFGWLLFRSADLQMFLRALNQWDEPLFTQDLLWTMLILLPVLLIQITQRKKTLQARAIRHPLGQALLYYAALYMVLYLPPIQVQQFIYVQF